VSQNHSTALLSLTLSDIDRFSKFFHCADSARNAQQIKHQRSQTPKTCCYVMGPLQDAITSHYWSGEGFRDVTQFLVG